MRIDIRKLRKDKELTVEKLASLANMREDLIYKIQSGRTNPSMQSVERLAAGVGMTTVGFLAEYGKN